MFHIFLICSGLAALANLSVGFLLYAGLGFDGIVSYPLSIAFAFMIGMGVSFVLNRRFTYPPSDRPKRREMLDFVAVSLVGLFFTTSIAQGLRLSATSVLEAVSSVGLMPEFAAHIAAVGVTAIYSFFAHKFISFRNEGKSPAQSETLAGVRQNSG